MTDSVFIVTVKASCVRHVYFLLFCCVLRVDLDDFHTRVPGVSGGQQSSTLVSGP